MLEDRNSTDQTLPPHSPKWAKSIAYYLSTISIACIFAALLVTIQMDTSKSGGSGAFFLILIFSFMTGSFGAFVLAFLLRRAARYVGKGLLTWVIAGPVLACFLIWISRLLGSSLPDSWTTDKSLGQTLAFLLWGPMVLSKMWWTGIPIGLFVGLVGYGLDAEMDNTQK